MCCRQAQQVLLFWSIHSACFDLTDYPQTLKYATLKFNFCFEF